MVAGIELAIDVPSAGWWAAVTGLVLIAARHGRPADKPILDRTSTRAAFTKLTGEQVRAAVVALGIGVKDPGQIKFPPPGIHKDGPGWLARFDLPGAIVATSLLEKRDNLAAALRLPVDQVWPEVGPDHPGQVDLWVGYQPSSKMGQPRWALAADNARTSVFEPQPLHRRPAAAHLHRVVRAELPHRWPARLREELRRAHAPHDCHARPDR
ncbi:hypothetical protein [Micromonospora cathayae]|uniref:Uncharacterized protein n=1 Tax=Micromonospora cathayae TaxID=3028804 RepID=A0ABY7ZXP1_9ACTN|nr:hypothetical protein [Micromonospora sp. HUAS 3]WDZ87161.1 hypothetical protein PVK37_12535 [Micromonospora sp. HUAS 3]